MSATLRPDRCETCSYWSREPALATAVRRPIGSNSNIGCCHRDPPGIYRTAFERVSLFPEVHAHRTCGDWLPDIDPDGGGGEEAPVDNVVRLRDAA